MDREPIEHRAGAGTLRAGRAETAQVDRPTESADPEARAMLEQLAGEAARLRTLAAQLAAQRMLSPQVAALAARLRESAAQLEALLAPWRA